MGFRFRKLINIISGVCFNLSNGVLSLSVGLRGVFVFFGSWGIYVNLGLFGIGLSYCIWFDWVVCFRGENWMVIDLGFRQVFEQKVVEFMLVVIVICNIYELMLDLKIGISWVELEVVYLYNRMLFFQVLVLVCLEKLDYFVLLEKFVESEGISFLGKWFELELVKVECYVENFCWWQQELIDVECENIF